MDHQLLIYHQCKLIIQYNFFHNVYHKAFKKYQNQYTDDLLRLIKAFIFI